MKTHIFFLIASMLMLMMIAACKENAIKRDNDVLQQNMYYIPLQVGNEWVYNRIFETDTTIVSSKIIDTVNINNELYYVIKFSTPDIFDWGFYNLNTDSTALLRTSDGITYYRYWEDAEHLYRLFKDTSLSESEFTPEMKMYSDPDYEIHPFLGSNIQYLQVEEGGGAEPFLYDYAKGFGLVKFVWFKGYCELIYAKVNGIIYE